MPDWDRIALLVNGKLLSKGCRLPYWHDLTLISISVFSLPPGSVNFEVLGWTSPSTVPSQVVFVWPVSFHRLVVGVQRLAGAVWASWLKNLRRWDLTTWETGEQQVMFRTVSLRFVMCLVTRKVTLGEVNFWQDFGRRPRRRDHLTRYAIMRFSIRDQWWPCAILHGYRDRRPQRYRGSWVWPFGPRDVIDHVTVESAYLEYFTSKPNPKWIRCSVAEIYPSEDADLYRRPIGPTLWHTDTVSKNKALLKLTSRKPINL